MPRLCEVYPGICLTTEGKARKNLSQGGRRFPVGTSQFSNKNTMLIVLFYVLFVCKCVLYYCEHVSTQTQFKYINISTYKVVQI